MLQVGVQDGSLVGLDTLGNGHNLETDGTRKFWQMSDWDFQGDEVEQGYRDEKTRIVSTEWSEEQSKFLDILRDSQCCK